MFGKQAVEAAFLCNRCATCADKSDITREASGITVPARVRCFLLQLFLCVSTYFYFYYFFFHVTLVTPPDFGQMFTTLSP